MRRRRLAWILLAALPIGWYAVRAAQGWIGGVSYARGRLLAGNGSYEQALPLLERASSRPQVCLQQTLALAALRFKSPMTS